MQYIFFNEIKCKKGLIRKTQPLSISKEPCITEEKEKLINRKGGGVGVCPSDCSTCYVLNMNIQTTFRYLKTFVKFKGNF